MKKLLLLTILLCSSLLCQAQKERIILGDEQTSEFQLKGKRIAISLQSPEWWETSTYWDVLLENKFT